MVIRDHTTNGTISGSAILFRNYQTIRTLVLELMGLTVRNKINTFDFPQDHARISMSRLWETYVP